MRPETEAFLEQVRHAEAPSQEDEQRVLRALQASVAAGMMSSVAASASRSDAWLAKGGSAFASTIAKLGVLAVGTALGFSIERGSTLTEPTTSPAPVSPPAMTPPPIEAPVAAVPSAAPAPAPSSIRPAALPPVPRKAPSEHVPSLRSELHVLEKAQRALKDGDGEAALRELDATLTSDGPLRAERHAARILALCSAGREAEARAAIARFFEEYPASAHRAAIFGGCANLQRIELR